MRKRLNYTGRKKIPQRLVSVSLRKTEPRSFGVEWDNLKLPPSGAVYVEAYSSGSPTVMRFPWGTVGSPAPPAETSLTDVDGESVSFDLKVVDESESIGRLLGVCRNIRPRAPDEAVDEQSGRLSILPVNPVDLGDRVWRMSFAHDWPWLEVNNQIPGIMELVRHDQRFFALVFPEIVRRILVEIVLTRGISRPDDTESEWQSLWLRWGIHWHPDGISPEEDEDAVDAKVEWIERVVESFCRRHAVRDKFMQSLLLEASTK